MSLIFGTTSVPAGPPVEWTGLTMKWIGWDGSEWVLTDETTGTVLMSGVRGLNMPPVIHHRAAHASMPGARWRGSTVDIREIFWPLQIFTGDGSRAWVERDRAFWKTIDPARPGTWIVIQPSGEQRKLQMRFKDDTNYAILHDPAYRGWTNYGITFEAEQPYWEGDPVVNTWEVGSSSDFRGAGGPPFTISPSGTLAEAETENPGDVDTYIVWKIYGPTTSATVGVDGRNITVPFSIAAGDVLVIDTDPRAQTALMGPAAGPWTIDKTPDLGSIDFAPLPAGAVTTLSLSLAGTGKIAASFTPHYYRAW